MLSSLWKLVWRTTVPSTWVQVEALRPVGLSARWPAVPCKIDPTRNRCRSTEHIQTMEPSRVTNAAQYRTESRAWSAIK